MNHFSLAAFKISSLSFSGLIVLCWGLNHFVCILLGFIMLYGTGDKCFTWNLKVWANISSNLFSPFCVFSLFCGSFLLHICWPMVYLTFSLRSLRLFTFVHFFLLFGLDKSYWCIFKFCLLLYIKFTDSCVNIYLFCWVLVAAYRIFNLLQHMGSLVVTCKLSVVACGI